MKKLTFLAFLILSFSSNLQSQNWTEPVNVSNLTGQDRSPDFAIDNYNIIHCVWVHDIELNFSKIYYSKSVDEGATWATPENISQNNEKSFGSPHVITDSNNRIIVTYDYNVGDPANTKILMKINDGFSWSSADTITPDLPGSRQSKLVLDNYNRLYCFWYHDINNGTSFYKYFENDIWSETITVYPGNHYLAVIKGVCDPSNKIHFLGKYHAEGENHSKDRLIYLSMINNIWLPFEEISSPTESPGQDIDIDSDNRPHVAYRQKSPVSPPFEDSTVYTHFDGNSWTEPELVVEDPHNQKIIIDEHNKPNIFDIEKTENGCMLVHHYKNGDQWEGFIIDSSPWNTSHYVIINRNFSILAVYNKPTNNNEGDLFFSKTDIIMTIDEGILTSNLTDFKIFPNPFYNVSTIYFTLKMPCFVEVKIYSFQGQLIKTQINEKKEPGIYQVLWDGKDQNGKVVESGLYLVRLQSGRNILTRSVEFIK
jgi:hypothetical protein